MTFRTVVSVAFLSLFSAMTVGDELVSYAAEPKNSQKTLDHTRKRLMFRQQQQERLPRTDKDSKSSLSSIVSGLQNRVRHARGLQDECVDVYDDLEARARKAGSDYLRRFVDNWHLVKRHDKKFDALQSAITGHEKDFKEKYQNDVIELAEHLQALETVKALLKGIRKYQTEMTKIILQLKNAAVKASRIGFYNQIRFMSQSLPCMGPIYLQWESIHEELKDKTAGTREISSEAESQRENLRRKVEAQIEAYGQHIENLFKSANKINELKIRLKDIGFTNSGDFVRDKKV